MWWKRPYCWITEHVWDAFDYAGSMWPLEEDSRYLVFCNRCNLVNKD